MGVEEKIIGGSGNNNVVVELVEVNEDGTPVEPRKSHGFAVINWTTDFHEVFPSPAAAFAWAAAPNIDKNVDDTIYAGKEDAIENQTPPSDSSRPD